MRKYVAEIFDSTKYELAESPFYIKGKDDEVFSFVDITAGKFIKMHKDGRREEFSLGEEMGSAVPYNGGYLLAGTKGLYLLSDEDSSNAKLYVDLSSEFESYRRCNDCKADPKGRLYFGSSNGEDGYEPGGNLYLLNEDKSFTVLEANTLISNGMAWNKACDKFYFSDSLRHALFVFDYDVNTGIISNKKVLCEITDGASDGLCIDDEDNIWVAIWGGSRIEQRSGITGELMSVIDVDAKNVTSCCFGGDDNKTLYITTSGNDQTGEHDGCIFTCKVDISGPQPDKLVL